MTLLASVTSIPPDATTECSTPPIIGGCPRPSTSIRCCFVVARVAIAVVLPFAFPSILFVLVLSRSNSDAVVKFLDVMKLDIEAMSWSVEALNADLAIVLSFAFVLTSLVFAFISCVSVVRLLDVVRFRAVIALVLVFTLSSRVVVLSVMFADKAVMLRAVFCPSVVIAAALSPVFASSSRSNASSFNDMSRSLFVMFLCYIFV